MTTTFAPTFMGLQMAAPPVMPSGTYRLEMMEEGIRRIHNMPLSVIWGMLRAGVVSVPEGVFVPVLSFDGRVGDRPAPTLDLHPVNLTVVA